MIDSGNFKIVSVLNELIENKIIKQLHLAITHAHFDHVAAILELLMNAHRSSVPVNLYARFTTQLLPMDGLMASEVDGYSIEPQNVLQHVAFHNLDNEEGMSMSMPSNSDGYLSQITAVDPTDAVKHFLSSNGFVIVTLLPNGSTRTRIFTGDINPQSPNQPVDEILKGLTDYLNILVKTAQRSLIDDLDLVEIFMDLGHSKSHPDFAKIKVGLEDWAADFYRVRPGKLYFDHMKKNDGSQLMIGNKPLP
jgi:ribonuclease BN (tRNA processing enzyme)